MKNESHKWYNYKNIFYKPVCSRCGLMRLNNPITHWCVRKGCNYDEHPDYEKTLKRLTRNTTWSIKGLSTG